MANIVLPDLGSSHQLDPLTNLPTEGKPSVPKLPPLRTTQPVLEARMETKYDVGTFPGQDLEEVRAEKQGAGEELMYTAARIPLVTGTKFLSGISSLGEFVVNTGRAINQGSLDPYFETPVSDKVNIAEELLKENLPLYNETGDRNKNFLQRAFTDKEFWMDDILSDAVPFLASAYLTGYGTTKMLQPLTESIYASKLANATKMGMQELAAMEAAGAAPEVIQEVKAANALREAGLAATKNNINQLVTTGMSRSVESLVEGAQTKKDVYNYLIEQGYSPEEAKSKAATAAMAVAGMNMLLAPLDYDQYSGWFKTFSKSRDAITRGESMGMSFLKHAGRNAFTEGILEEGLQNAMQKYAQAKYTGQYKDEDLGALEGVLSEYFKGFGTKEGWDAMGTGMIVGGLFGGVTEAFGDKSKAERYENLKTLIANNDYLKENFTDYVKQDPVTGQTVVNENKILSLFAQMGNDGLLSDAMKNQLVNNYEEAYKTIDNIRFGNWAFTHFEAGQGESLMKKIQDLGDLSAEEFKAQGILTGDMKNSNGKLVTPKDISQRYLEKALEYEKLYNQVSSRFDLPNRAALKNVFDEAVLQKEATVSLNKINNKISSLQSDISARAMAMGTPEFLETAGTPMPKSLEEKELEMLQNRKQDLINTLKDSYMRLDEWTNPEKLAAKAKAQEESRAAATREAKSRNLADKISKDPKYKMSKEESKFYSQNKEEVDKRVTKTPEEVKKSEEKTKSEDPIRKTGKIQKFGESGQLTFNKVRYEDGFPIYSVTNPDGTVSEYSSKEGWGEVDVTDTDRQTDKEQLNGKNHFANLFKYRFSAEKNLMKTVRATMQKQDGSAYSAQELMEMYPEAFPSLRANEVTKKVLKRSDWSKFISFRVDKKYTPGEPFALKSGLYGNRSPLDFALSVTDPETGEVHEVHHTQNPYFYSYEATDGTKKLVDFSAITLDQFNNMFTVQPVVQGKEFPASQDDLDNIKQQWFDLKSFYDKVNAWYVDNRLEGPQEIPSDWYTMAPVTALDIIEDPNQPLTPLASVPAFANAPIISAYDQRVINGKTMDPEAPDTPKTSFSNAYYAYFKDANGYKAWVRLSPKKILAGQEVVDKINTAVDKLYDINPDLVGTPEGDAAAKAIVEELGIYIASGVKDQFETKVEFSAFRPEGKFRYYLQIQSTVKSAEGKQRTRLVFEQNDAPVTFENDADLNEFFFKKKDKLGNVLLNTKKSFRQSLPKGIVDPNAAELFDLITSPNVVQDYTIRFNFGNILPSGDAMGLENFKPKKGKPVKTPDTALSSLEKEISDIDTKLASGKLSQSEARNLANKKVNLQKKLEKLVSEKPIEASPDMLAASQQFMPYGVNEGLSEYLGETMAAGLTVSPAGNLDTDQEVVAFLESEAKSSDSRRSKIANAILNKLSGSLSKVASTQAVQDPVDQMLEKMKEIETKGGRVIRVKTPGEGINSIEVPPTDISADVPSDINMSDINSKIQSEQEKIAREVAKRKSGKGGISFDAADKTGYVAPGEPWTVEQAANWLGRILPKEISVEEISPLMANLSNGRVRYGYFKDNVIALTNNAPRTLAFHEAFHGIFRAVLSDSERARYTKLMKDELGLSDQQVAVRVSRLRASNPENYATLSYAEMENRVYEEAMADKYASWQNRRGPTRNIFQKLFDLISRVVDFFRGEHSLDSLFRKIERGAFVKSNVNPGFKESADKVLGLLSPIKSQEVIYNVAGSYFSKRDNGINVTLEDVMDDHMRMYDPAKPENAKLSEERPDLFSALNNLYYVYADPEERTIIKEQVQQLIAATRYNPQVLDAEEFEGDSEANGGSDTERVHDKSAQEYDPYDKLGSEVKRFFGTTTYETLDDFGNIVTRALDPRNIYARLLPQLSASHIRRDQIMSKLEVLSRTDNVIKAVYDRLVKVTGVSEETPNGTGNGELFLNRFKLAFQVYQYKYTQAIINPGKEVYVMYVNKTDLGKYAFERWENDFRQYVIPKLKDSKFRDDIINNGLNKALRFWDTDPVKAADFLYQSLEKLKIHVDVDYVRHSFDIPGLATNKELFEDVQFLDKDFTTALKTAINSATDIYNKEEDNSLVTRLKTIAAGNAQFDGNVIMPNYKTPEGNMAYSYSDGNFVMESTRDMNSNAKSLEWVKSMMADPRFKNNVILNNGSTSQAMEVFAQAVLSNVEVAITGSIKDVDSGKGVSTKNLDVQSAQMNYLAMFSTMRNVPYGDKGNFTQSQYWLTQVAEKNNQIAATLPRMEYAIKNEDGNLVITPMAQDHLYKMFLQEEARIEHVKNGNKLGYLNGGRVYFPYLEGIKTGDRNSIIEQILYGLHDSTGKPNGEGLIKIIDNYFENEVMANKLDVAIDPAVLEKTYKKDKRAFVADLIINDFIWTNSYLQLLGMDIGVAKNFEDFVKRAALLIAAGPSLNSAESTHVISYTKETVQYVDKNTFKRLVGDHRNNPNAKNVQVSDAQVYSIAESLLSDLIFQGKIDDRTIKAFRRLINPIETVVDENGNQSRIYVPLTQEEKELLDLIPKKEVIAGVSVDGKTVYQKMAVAFLTKDLTSIWDGEKWVARQGYEELHNKREHLEKIFNDNNGKTTVHLAPLSASKLYFPADALAADAFLTPDAIGKGPVTNITNNHRREQVYNATKTNDTMVYSLQQHAISGSELLDQKGRALKQIQEEAFAALRNDAFDFSANLIRSVDSDGTISKANLEIFLESLRNQILSTTPDSQLYEFLKSDGEGNFKYSPDLVHVAAKFESLFLSTFKEAFRNKIAGRKATLMSDQGISILVEITKDSEGNDVEGRIVTRAEQESFSDQTQFLDKTKYKARKLNFMSQISDEEGNSRIKPAEIMMTRKRAELLGINVTDPSKADYMRVISTRIPTQNYHSIMPAVIVDFLPEYYGDTVVGPMELVLMMGADFDVDALYTYMQDFWMKNGKTIKYGEETTAEDKHAAYNYWHLNNNRILNDQISKRVNSDPLIQEVKTLLNTQRQLSTLNKQTRDAIKNSLKILEETSVEKGDVENIGKIISELSEQLLEIKVESGDIRTALTNLGTLSNLYSGHVQEAMKSLGMPSTFAEWQAAGSPVSRGELYNNLFDVNFEMFTQGQLWDAYKQYLNTDSTDNALAKVDENPASKIKPLRLGNSIPSKAVAFKINSASTPLRGVIVTSNVAGMFMREFGVRLKEGIDFVDNEGNYLTYFDFPSVDAKSSVEEIQDKLKQIRTISDIGSQMVGLVIDDPKEPKLYKLNWNINTLPSIADAVSMGMPKDFVFKLFALPVFKQLDNAITRKTRIISPESGGKFKAIEEIEGIYGGLTSRISGILNLTKKFTKEQVETLANEFGKPISGKMIDDALVFNPKTTLLDNSGKMLSDSKIAKQFQELSMEDLAKELQYYNASDRALKFFKEMSANAQYRSQTLTPISALNRKVGSSLDDVNSVVDAIDKLDNYDDSPYENLKDAVYSSENMANNISNIKKVRDYTELYFTKQTPFFKDFFSNIKSILKPWLKLSDKEQIARQSMSALISHAINTATENKDFTYLLENGGENSIVKMYKELKDIPEFRENPLVKWAFPKEYNAKDKTSYYPIDTLKFDTFTKLDPVLNERLIDGHTSLLNSSNERIAKFGRNLFWYAFAKDGLMFKAEAASKFLAPESFLPVADAFKDIHDRARDNFETLIPEYFEESMQDIKDRFTENFLRHRGFERYIDFASKSDFTSFNPTGKKPLSLFKVITNADKVTIEYSGLGTPAQANTHLRSKNIPFEVVSGLKETTVKYPRFFAMAVSEGMGKSTKYRLKLESVKDGLATYKVLKPFGDYEMTISPFPRSPKENEQMYSQFAKSSGRVAPEIESEYGNVPAEFYFNNPAATPASEYVEKVPEGASSFEDYGRFEDTAPNSSMQDYETYKKASQESVGEALEGLKKFTKAKPETKDQDFDPDDISTKCKS